MAVWQVLSNGILPGLKGKLVSPIVAGTHLTCRKSADVTQTTVLVLAACMMVAMNWHVLAT